MGSAARMRHVISVIRAVRFNERDQGDCHFVLKGSPHIWGSKCPKWAILTEIFSRSPLVLIPFFSRSSLVNEKYPHIWTGDIPGKGESHLFDIGRKRVVRILKAI